MGNLPDKWTAFWLSLVLPGAGQAAARSWTAILWLVVEIGLAIALRTGDSTGIDPIDPLRLAAFSAVGLMSAEHAKRLLEASPAADRRGKSTCIQRQVACRRGGRRSIDVLMTLEFACPYSELWSAIADLPKFLVIDPFHDRVILQELPAKAGVDLVLSHNAFGRRFLRFGRILAWNEGRSYTFSDLSRLNAKTGFPHMFIVAIESLDESQRPVDQPRSTLTVRVRGRWTSRIVPPSVGRLWVTWVCREHARLLAKAL